MKTLEKGDYEPQDPRLNNEKAWLNARTSLVRKAVRKLRKEGVNVPPHGSEFVIACAAPFRASQEVTPTQVEEIVQKFSAFVAN
jgi:hypothetical protein